MKCSGCGAEAQDGMRFCGMCGRPLSDGAVAPGVAKARYCRGCGRSIPWDSNVCQYCGHDYRAGTGR